MDKIIEQLKVANYDHAIAIATREEIENGAACGQLCIVVEETQKNENKG